MDRGAQQATVHGAESDTTEVTERVHTHTHTHTHVYKYLCVRAYVYIYVKFWLWGTYCQDLSEELLLVMRIRYLSQ